MPAWGRGASLPAELAAVAEALARRPAALADQLAAALADELPHLKRDGGFVRPGFRAELDEARQLRDESRRVIAGLQAGYAADTDIRTLRIKHNNVLGYFIEVGANNAERMMSPPLNARFIHRQTLASAVRFTTTELADLEARIAGAADRALAIELEVFDALTAAVVAEAAGAAGDRRRPCRARCRRRPRRAGRGRGLLPPDGRPLARLRMSRRPPRGGRAGAARRRGGPLRRQ